MFQAGIYTDGPHALQAARRIADIFADDAYSLLVKEVGWNFIADELPQIDRHLNHKAMLCVSKQHVNGKLASAFAKGVLWVRGGVVAPVPVLQPARYVDPTCTTLESGIGACLSKKALLKQHVSGAGMYTKAAASIQT